jgi:bifunctional non-homologous end joining protein LigD
MAEEIASELCAHHPDRFTTAFKKVDRGDKIFVDVGRNYPGATVVASWAVRARPGAPVAMPVRWDEVDRTSPRHFTIRTAPERLAVDAWAGFERARVSARTIR